jgi:DNA-binding NarL/FixJ family response regulator
VSAPGVAIVLVGSWRAVFGLEKPMRTRRMTIYPSSAERASLRQVALGVQLNWLLLGEGIDKDQLFGVVASIRSLQPQVKLAVLGPLDDLDRCESWLRHGAQVYLGVDASVEKMIGAMKQAVQLDAGIFDERFQQLAYERQVNLDIVLQEADLTERERQVVRLLRFGLKNVDIAAALGIGESTVEYHVGHILSKLRAANRTEAASHASVLDL